MSKKAILLSGISGAGKSTETLKLTKENPEIQIISKDLIRQRNFEYDTEVNFWDQYSFKEEKKIGVSTVMYMEIEECSKDNKSIIIDNTNLSLTKNQSLTEYLEQKGYSVEFVNLNVSDNINYYQERNSNRLNSVGPGVVNDQFLLASFSGYIDFKNKSKIAIVDLDGTVALKGDRGVFDYNKSYKDKPNTYVIETVQALLDSDVIDHVQFLSGRESYSYKVTRDWLSDNNFDMDKHSLLLRKSGDRRKDIVIKKEIFDACIKHNDIFAVFDDRPQVIDLWWDLKLPVFHVGDYRNNF